VSLLTPTVAFGAALVLFVWVAIGAWVNFDAHARGSDHPGFWGVVAPVSGIVLLYYLLWWRRGRSRRYPPSRWERATAIVVVAGLGGLVVGSLVSPPDPISQLTVWPVAFAGCLPVAYWAVRRRFGTSGDGYAGR
jgi:quinol-cytochrome oxidoreductase complex cytochrome b subunit